MQEILFLTGYDLKIRNGRANHCRDDRGGNGADFHYTAFGDNGNRGFLHHRADYGNGCGFGYSRWYNLL